METWVLIVIQAGSFFLTLIVAIITAAWALSRSNAELIKSFNDKIDEHSKVAVQQMAELENKLDNDIDQLTKRYGESLQAIRQKINEVELWNRDNLVSKATFRTVIDDFKQLHIRLENRLNERFDRLEKKLDGISLP